MKNMTEMRSVFDWQFKYQQSRTAPLTSSEASGLETCLLQPQENHPSIARLHTTVIGSYLHLCVCVCVYVCVSVRVCVSSHNCCRMISTPLSGKHLPFNQCHSVIVKNAHSCCKMSCQTRYVFPNISPTSKMWSRDTRPQYRDKQRAADCGPDPGQIRPGSGRGPEQIKPFFLSQGRGAEAAI